MEAANELRQRLAARAHADEQALNINNIELRLVEATDESAEAEKKKADAKAKRIAKELERHELEIAAAVTAAQIAELPQLPGKWKRFEECLRRWGVRGPSFIEILTLVLTAVGLYFAVRTYYNTDAKTLNNLLARQHCHAIENGVHSTAEDCLRAALQKATTGK